MEKSRKTMLNYCIVLVSVLVVAAIAVFAIHNVLSPHNEPQMMNEPFGPQYTASASPEATLPVAPTLRPGLDPTPEEEPVPSEEPVPEPEFDSLINAYKVVIDGAVVGIMNEEPDIDSVIEQLKNKYESEEGVSNAVTVVGNSITVEKMQTFAHNLTEDDIINNALAECVSFKIHATKLSVDGVFLGYFETKDECSSIVSEAKEKFQRQYLSGKKVKSLDYDRSFTFDECEIYKEDLGLITHNDSIDMIVSDRLVDKPVNVTTEEELNAAFAAHKILSDYNEALASLKETGAATVFYAERLVNFNAVAESSSSSAIAFSTTYRANASLSHSARKVAQTGKNGTKTQVFSDVYINGVLTSHTLVSTKTVNPTTQIIEYGLKLSLYENVSANTGSSYFHIPCSGIIYQLFKKSVHQGIDIAAPSGTPIYAAAAGTVESVITRPDWYGKYVVILHDNGYRTIYAHMSGFNVKVGQRVSQGSVIGYVGMTGSATGYHCHFSILDKSKNYVDPTTLLYGY